ADTDDARCAAVAPGSPAYASAAELVAAGGIDALVVATPASAHPSDARAAAAAGLPSIIEKPPARDGAAARLLAELEPPPAIGFNRRFEPALREAHTRLIERGSTDIKLVFHYRRASWAPRVVADDALLDLGPHLIDLVLWLGRAPIRRVRTTIHDHDRCSLELELEGGSASLSCASDRVYRELVEVRDADGSLVVRRSRGGLLGAALTRLRPASDHLVESLAAQLQAFCVFVRGGSHPDLATAADGLAVMSTIDAARRSHLAGGVWVEVPAEEASTTLS
ncbi:MAG: hypothetical protein QOE13_1718, partial [Gaiellaceae bacterium]|nr:hypothetical protein [Gaiellaceae bacterium]